MTERPESDVVEWIDQMLKADDVDAWIDSQVARGPRDDYSVDRGQLRCPWGPHEFHGTPHGSCPGSHYTREEFAAAKESMRVSGTARNPHYSFAEDDSSLSIECHTWLPGDCRCSCWGCLQIDHRHCGGSQCTPADHARGYTLADIESMRGGFVRPYLPPVIRGPQPVQIPRVLVHPRVRFWATDPESGSLRCMEGELYIRNIETVVTALNTIHTITASLFPPVNEYLLTPQALVDEITADASTEGEAFPSPSGPVDPENISMEVQNSTNVEDSTLTGFQPVGTMAPDACEFSVERDYDRITDGCGRTLRTIQTREDYSVSMQMNAEYVNAPLLQELIFGGGHNP